ncbi:asparagine synthase-related protein [Photobacterium kasasachensis]|uniref:asparagine synthase-related protein n=1 Tax=Photobacterium kasasachensis TaxID=2910240 RepID=UPI003D0C00CE
MKSYNFKINKKQKHQSNSNLAVDSFVQFENEDYLLLGDCRLYGNKVDPSSIIADFLDCNKGPSSIDGEFSFVLVNKKEGKAYLVRDQMGVKNIYYTVENDELKISSNVFDLISMRTNKEFSVDGVAQYLIYEYVQDPITLFEDVWSVERGQVIEIKLDSLSILSKDYFRLPLREIKENNDEGIDYFSSKLRDEITAAHEKRVKSNNTIMLSGGIDSTVMAIALKKDLGISNLNSVTFDTKYADFSEAEYASSVAKKMGIKHSVIQVDPFNESVDLFDIVDRSNFPYHGSIMLNAIMKSGKIEENSNFFSGQDTRIHTPSLHTFDTAYFNYFRNNNINSLIAKLSDFILDKNLVNNGKVKKVLKRGRIFNRREQYILSNMYHMHDESLIFDSEYIEKHNERLFKEFEAAPSDLRSLYNHIVDFAWSWQYTDDIAYMTNNFNHAGHNNSMPFYDIGLANFSASIPMKFALHRTKGKSGFGKKSKYVNKYVLREAYKQDLSQELIYRDKAVAITNHTYLNTVMSDHISNFFSAPKLKSTKAYEILGLDKLVKIALKNNKCWNVTDYLQVVEIQNLLFLEVIARKYDVCN